MASWKIPAGVMEVSWKISKPLLGKFWQAMFDFQVNQVVLYDQTRVIINTSLLQITVDMQKTSLPLDHSPWKLICPYLPCTLLGVLRFGSLG